MTRIILAIIILAHSIATLIVTLRTRRNYWSMRHMLTPRQRFWLRWGWTLVAYDAVIALLVFA